MLLLPTNYYEFNPLDPGKLCSILNTHLLNSMNSPNEESSSSTNHYNDIPIYNDHSDHKEIIEEEEVKKDKLLSLYSSFVVQIKLCFYKTCTNCFDIARVDFKLCEFFTVLGIYIYITK